MTSFASLIGAIALAAATTVAALPSHAAEALTRGASGYPLPRFVSLSSSEVNVRMGPSFKHKVKWTYLKAGLPVEIVREFGNWRRVRDADGEEGWVHHSLLSGRRTALVAPWGGSDMVPLRVSANETAPARAMLEPLVLAAVEGCDGNWCEVSGAGWHGHVRQATLWGVYPQEKLD
ncbi:MAG: SH3 domain-containing protein [Pseudomonadota bacterium]